MSYPKEFEEKLRSILLGTFKKLIDFLDRNDLKYFAAYGTLLGAVRHKGLIPWDDDIDIFMPRNEYQRLLSMNNSLEEIGLRLFSPADMGYYFPYGKVINMKTTLVEHPYHMFPLGVFIDIFPLDFYNIDENQIKVYHRKAFNLFERYRSTIAQYPWKYLTQRLSGDVDIVGYRSFFYSKLPFSCPSKRLKTYNSYIEDIAHNDGPVATELNGDGWIYKTEWFDNLIEVPFEYFKVKIPKEYDAYLKNCYGDYMTPPPEEKRISPHKVYYYNLNERLSIDDIKKRIQEGKILEY